MKIIFFPEWKITFLVNYTTKIQLDLLQNLQKDYDSFIQNKYTIIENCHKMMIFNNYYSIDDLYSNLKSNFSNGIDIINQLKSSKLISFLVNPEIYLYLAIASNNNYQLQDYETISINLINNVKKIVWKCQNDLQPQWYSISDNSNQQLTNLNILNDITNLKDYLPESISEVLLKKFQKSGFIEEEILLKNKVIELFKNLKYQDYQDIIKYLYQNDYYFIKEFNNLLGNPNKINYELINKYLMNTKKKPPIFTIITPTMGNDTLYRLKQVLKQESVPFIHLIMWDNNRKVDKNGNYINPKDLEDSNTFCYEFTHPYFEFNGQRNDVWLRGVGATLTNTPYVTYFDDDTWPERDHLYKIMKYMNSKKINYTYVIRRMWENHNKSLGLDNFEAIGKINKFGYRLIDNSSIYMRLEVARKILNVFLAHQVYGDDRFTPNFLDEDKECKGERMEQVLVNHIAKNTLLTYFKNNVTKE